MPPEDGTGGNLPPSISARLSTSSIAAALLVEAGTEWDVVIYVICISHIAARIVQLTPESHWLFQLLYLEAYRNGENPLTKQHRTEIRKVSKSSHQDPSEWI